MLHMAVDRAVGAIACAKSIARKKNAKAFGTAVALYFAMQR
jgi:hypothetical protein